MNDLFIEASIHRRLTLASHLGKTWHKHASSSRLYNDTMQITQINWSTYLFLCDIINGCYDIYLIFFICQENSLWNACFFQNLSCVLLDDDTNKIWEINHTFTICEQLNQNIGSWFSISCIATQRVCWIVNDTLSLTLVRILKPFNNKLQIFNKMFNHITICVFEATKNNVLKINDIKTGPWQHV